MAVAAPVAGTAASAPPPPTGSVAVAAPVPGTAASAPPPPTGSVAVAAPVPGSVQACIGLSKPLGAGGVSLFPASPPPPPPVSAFGSFGPVSELEIPNSSFAASTAFSNSKI